MMGERGSEGEHKWLTSEHRDWTIFPLTFSLQASHEQNFVSGKMARSVGALEIILAPSGFPINLCKTVREFESEDHAIAADGGSSTEQQHCSHAKAAKNFQHLIPLGVTGLYITPLEASLLNFFFFAAFHSTEGYKVSDKKILVVYS